MCQKITPVIIPLTVNKDVKIFWWKTNLLHHWHFPTKLKIMNIHVNGCQRLLWHDMLDWIPLITSSDVTACIYRYWLRHYATYNCVMAFLSEIKIVKKKHKKTQTKFFLTWTVQCSKLSSWFITIKSLLTNLLHKN